MDFETLRALAGAESHLVFQSCIRLGLGLTVLRWLLCCVGFDGL